MKSKAKLGVFVLSIAIFCIFSNIALGAEQQASDKAEPEKSINTGMTALQDEVIKDFTAEGDMKATIMSPEPYSMKYGGWFNSIYEDSNYTKNRTSVSSAKIWFATPLPLNSDIYLRISDTYKYYIDSAIKQDNQNIFDIDIASLTITNKSKAIKISLGRKYFTLGTGLAFNGNGDGGEFSLLTNFADFKIFALYTGLLNKNSNTMRMLAGQDLDEGKRIFIGGNMTRYFNNQTFYLFGLYQIDKNSEPAGIRSKYDTQHYGIGMKGPIGNAYYFSEILLEQGKNFTSYTDGSQTVQQVEEYINAAAGIFSVNYFFNFDIKPALLISYAIGTGDGDRQNALSTNGNTSDEDNGFLYFGDYFGGYALSPMLSNMHIFRAGFSISPLYKIDKIYLKRLNLVANYSNYQKFSTNSTINSGEAQGKGRDIGHGIDIALKWQIFSDFSIYGDYGFFMPGSAYEKNENKANRTYLMAGAYLAF